MLEVVLTIPFWFEMVATVTGAISGAMSASRAKFDIIGAMAIATLVGLFGGVMRDVMLQNYGIYAFQKPELIVACVIAAIVVFYFGRLVNYLDPVVDLIDSLSVGLWGIISVGKALSAGVGIVPAVVLGIVTAVGGGIVRDVIMNKPVAVFQAGTLYGGAAVIGCIVFALMKTNHIFDAWSSYACVALVVLLRYLSLWFGWRTKPSRDLTGDVVDAVAKPVRAITGRRPPARVLDEEEKTKKKISQRTFNKKRDKKKK